MTTSPSTDYVPEWTQGDRLRKARSVTGMTVREFADHIGVSHGTITSAETDARAVRPITLKAWALATGVSEAWLKTGINETAPTPPTPGRRDEAALAAIVAKSRSRGQHSGTTRHYLPQTVAAA